MPNALLVNFSNPMSANCWALNKVTKIKDHRLVLHSSSGLSDGVVRECVDRGICKVNFATELRQSFTGHLRQALAASPAGFDPKPFMKYVREAVVALVEQRIIVCGSNGKA